MTDLTPVDRAPATCDESTFEDLLASPHLQFDPDSELLPHLLAFGPPKSPRPWLFDPVVKTTAACWTTEDQKGPARA